MADITRYDIFKVNNPLNVPFSMRWDNQPYTIPAGGSILVPSFLAKHAEKKIVDILMQKKHGVKSIYNKALRRKAAVGIITRTTEAAPEVQKSEGEEIKEQVEALQPEQTTETPEPETNGFEGLNESQPEPVPATPEPGAIVGDEETPDVTEVPDEEELRQEALQDSNPAEARGVELRAMEYAQLQEVAKTLGIKANQSTDDLVDAIVTKEFQTPQA